MPLVLHGGSGAGEENIRKAVAYGINKINVCTDAFEVAKEAFIKECQGTTEKDYLAISMDVEKAVKHFVVDYIKMIGSSNRYIYGVSAYSGHE